MHKHYGLAVLLLILFLYVNPVAAQNGPDFAVADRYELKGGHVLLYDKDYTALAIQFKDGRPEIISDYCSYPAVKPDKSAFAFLEPWGFEEKSALLLCNLASRETVLVEIPEIPERDTPKEIVWLDNGLLLLIAGFTDGTVTAGGKLYYYDDVNKTSGLVIDTQNLEISRIKLDANKAVLTLVGNEYYFIVANYINILRDTDTTEIPLKELRRLIKGNETFTIAEPPEKQVLYRLQVLAGWLYGKVLEQHGFDPVAVIIKRE